MKSKKDISDLIRDNQHKLDERPNPRAWKKLEAKLDQEEGKNKRPTRILMYRSFAMAAAVVAMVAVISIINTQSSSNDMAKAEANLSPQDQFAQGLEPVYSKEDNNLRQVIEFKRQLKDRYANPIQEGTQTKKLLASNNRRTKINEPSISNDALAVNEQPSPKANLKIEEHAGNIAMEISEDDVTESEMMEEATIALNDVTADAMPPPPASRTYAKKERKKDASLSRSKALPTGIKRLQWMVGDWSRNQKTLNILLLNNSDLVCSDFRIKEIGNELFYIDSNDSTFELINQSLNQFVFKHKNKDQVTIELIDKNKFSKTWIKSKSGEKLVEVFTKK